MKRFLAKQYNNFEIKHSMKFINQENVIDLSLGDSDLTTDLEIIEKTFTDIKNGHTHYANPYGLSELRVALCDSFAKDYHINYVVDECLVTTSGNHAIWLALHAIINKGDEILILEPYYPFYPQQVKAAGGTPVLVQLDSANGFHLDLEQINKKITPKTKALILNSPNNPTGCCYSKSELEELAKIVIKHDLIVISDEIYTHFCYQDEHIPFSAITDMRNHTILIGSFSKNYVMTGWRVGFIFTNPELIFIMKEINENNTFTSPTISQRAAIHALNSRDRIQKYLYNEFKERLFFLYNELKKIDILKVIKPEGAIYLFIDVSKTKMTGKEFADLLLEKAHVAVIPGYSYGESAKNFIRLTASRNLTELKIAVVRIKAFINNITEFKKENKNLT